MKRTISFIIALLLVFGGAAMFVGCGNTKVPNSETDLQISFWKAGFGDTYMKQIIEAFETKHPEYNVIFDSSSDGFVYANTITQGSSNTVDLYCTSVIDQPYKEYAEPLDDILSCTVEGESVTIGNKLIPEVKDGLKFPDGHYYGLSYSGALEGIVYNQTIIDGVKYKVPRTTNELADLVTNLANDADLKDTTKPFIHFKLGGYWNRVYKVWQAQYDGLDYYYNTFFTLSKDGVSPSKDVITATDGRKAALDVLGSIIREDTVVSGSNALVYTNAQTMFMNGSAAMMVTGNWLVNEMKSNTEATATDLKMMKTPVISSIRHRTPSIESDYELRYLIDAIDAAGSISEIALSGENYDVTEEDLNAVYEARNLMSSNFDGEVFIIPEYSNAKAAAKEFIKFYYSDEAIRIFANNTHSASPARLSSGSIDTADWLDFEKTAIELTQTSIPVLQEAVPYRNVLFTEGGLNAYGKTEVIAAFFAESRDRKTADVLWSEAVSYFNNNWNTFLQNAGLR